MYLAQTWQFYAEAAIYALGKIYTISPSFRAEKSKTSRHLTEYWHTEMELAWSDLDELMDYADGMIKNVVKQFFEIKKDEKLIKKILKRATTLREILLASKLQKRTYEKTSKQCKKCCFRKNCWK